MPRGVPGLKRPKSENGEDMITPAELAKLTGLSVEYIRERCRGGRGGLIPSIKIMNKVFLDRQKALQAIYKNDNSDIQTPAPSVAVPSWL